MNILNVFKNKLFQQKQCPIPDEYLDKIGHIIICSGNKCCKCHHFLKYQLESYRKEIADFINEQHKTIIKLQKALYKSQHDLKVANKMVDLVFDRWGCDSCPRVCFKKENQPNCREMNFNNFKKQALEQLKDGE